jgi:hypothetical protein
MTRYLLLFDSYSLVFLGAPSLTRGRVLYMLLSLASAVFLGSESLGTRDHILLSQIWDFPFRRFLRLAGSRWRYSTPPPHGFAPLNWLNTNIRYVSRHGPHRKRLFHYWMFPRCRRNMSTELLYCRLFTQLLLGNGAYISMVEANWGFGGRHCLHLQCRRVSFSSRIGRLYGVSFQEIIFFIFWDVRISTPVHPVPVSCHVANRTNFWSSAVFTNFAIKCP